MNIGIIGLNHKLAQIDLRETFSRHCHALFHEKMIHDDHAHILLSTCNRTEIYFSSENLSATHSYILARLRGPLEADFDQKLYTFLEENAFRHLLRVVSGLDSAIIGETEIQGQVRRAYTETTRQKPLPKPLHFLFQKALKAGKWIRSHFFLERESDPLADAILQLGGNLKNTLLIGASEINCKLAKSLKKANLTLCNRSEDKGRQAADRLKIPFLPWSALNTWSSFDTVILSTKAKTPLINSYSGKKTIQLFDLSVPRNVCPSLETHPQITLFGIDHLNARIEEKQTHRRGLASHLEHLIDLEAKRTVALFNRHPPILLNELSKITQ